VTEQLCPGPSGVARQLGTGTLKTNPAAPTGAGIGIVTVRGPAALTLAIVRVAVALPAGGPNFTVPKFNDGVTATPLAGMTAEPDSGTVSAAPEPGLKDTCSVPVRVTGAPTVADGVNTTETTQVALAARLDGHVLDATLKSDGFVLTCGAIFDKGALPALVRVTDCDGLELRSVWSANVRLDGAAVSGLATGDDAALL